MTGHFCSHAPCDSTLGLLIQSTLDQAEGRTGSLGPETIAQQPSAEAARAPDLRERLIAARQAKAAAAAAAAAQSTSVPLRSVISALPVAEGRGME